MKIRPLHDRLLVERLEEREVKKGGIIIPDTAKEKPQEGKVIGVAGTGGGSDSLLSPASPSIGVVRLEHERPYRD